MLLNRRALGTSELGNGGVVSGEAAIVTGLWVRSRVAVSVATAGVSGELGERGKRLGHPAGGSQDDDQQDGRSFGCYIHFLAPASCSLSG